ncbi:MAG: hypothetical protein ABIL69_10210 [candidate division WOR-3 bacterium]
MRNRKIERALAKIYNERSKWNGGKGPFIESDVKYRELILVKQRILQQLEEALLYKDKGEEKFNLILLELVNNYLKILKNKKKELIETRN